MRTRVFLVTSALASFVGALSGCTLPPQSAGDVSDAQIAVYQSNVVKGCEKSARARGLPEEKVTSRCGCVLDTLKASTQHSDWQQAYYYASRGEAEKEQAVFAEPMKKLVNCRGA